MTVSAYMALHGALAVFISECLGVPVLPYPAQLLRVLLGVPTCMRTQTYDAQFVRFRP